MSRFAVGDRVCTVSSIVRAEDWTPEALRQRRFPATGTVVQERTGHGLCYAVKHDGHESTGYYAPQELELVPKVTRKVRFPGLRSAWLAMRLALYDWRHPQ